MRVRRKSSVEVGRNCGQTATRGPGIATGQGPRPGTQLHEETPTMTFAPLSCLIIDGRGVIGVAFPKD